MKPEIAINHLLDKCPTTNKVKTSKVSCFSQQVHEFHKERKHIDHNNFVLVVPYNYVGITVNVKKPPLSDQFIYLHCNFLLIVH